MDAVWTRIWGLFADGYEMVIVVAVVLILVLFLMNHVVHRAPAPRRAKGRDASGSSDAHGDSTAVERRHLIAIMSDLRMDNRDLRTRVSHLGEMFALLGPLLKELNSIVDRREMGPLLLRVITRLFTPGQALVFLKRDGGRDFVLVARMGLHGIEEGYRLEVGRGIAGRVAEKKTLMTTRDLRFESNLVIKRIEDGEPTAFRTEIAAPILYRGDVLGVLCMGEVDELTPDIVSLFGMIGDMAAMALANHHQYSKIQQVADSDPLTQMFNKGYFLETCGPALTEARRLGRAASILMFDVDDFKLYNDTCGHLAGDQVLRELGEILRAEVRDGDILARYGGEEFVLLMPGVGSGIAKRTAERIRKRVEEHAFQRREVQSGGRITLSAGVASLPENGPGATELIEAADRALYQAKDGGRNRIVCATGRLVVKSTGLEGPAEEEKRSGSSEEALSRGKRRWVGD